MRNIGTSILSLAFLICCSLAASPFYMWSHQSAKGVEPKKEVLDPVSGSQLAQELKSILDSDNAFSAVLYLRPNLESSTLAQTIQQNYNEIHKMLKKTNKKTLERSFSDIQEGVVEAITELFPQSVKVNIDSEQAYTNFIEGIRNAPKPFIGQVYQVEFPEQMTHETHFDMMVSEIEKELSKRSYGKHMSAIVGTKPVSHRRSLSDTQVLSPRVDTLFIENVKGNTDASSVRSTYLTPVVTFGVSLGLILIFGMVYATLQLFDVQTPTSFVEKGLDWGRIEK